ncbi:MAG TPA: hypothetical protein VFY22_11345 [Hydrogenophaga sp.]|nr:hypothetical protein [Hydrogenophaga sp.]
MSDLLTRVTEASSDLLPLGEWVNAGVKVLLDNGAAVFDATDRLLGSISARSLLVKIAQEARHV